MRLNPHSPALLQFGMLLVLTARLAVADQPPSKDDFAPAERFSSEQLSHWAFQPVKRARPPAVKESSWVRNPIDRFILAELEKLDLNHSAAANRTALIRRVTFRPGRPAAIDAKRSRHS